MGLETGTSIDDLVITNPPSSDDKRQGDDHLRLIKKVLKNNFKDTSGRAFHFPRTSLETADFTVTIDDQNTLFLCDTTAGVINVTLPTLTTDDSGWSCSIMKIGSSAASVFLLAPGLFTLNGVTLNYIRRTAENIVTELLWEGSFWCASRPSGLLVGQVIEYYGATLPNGFLWCNGATFTLSEYVELNAVLGGVTLPDCRGRVSAGRDDLGGSDAGRLGTVIVGNGLMQAGGVETSTLIEANLPPHDHAVNGTTALDSPGHNHNYEFPNTGVTVQAYSAGPGEVVWDATRTSGVTSNPNQSHSHSISIVSGVGDGASTAFSNLQPTVLCNKIICAE